MLKFKYRFLFSLIFIYQINVKLTLFIFQFLGFKDSLNLSIHQKLPHLLSSGRVKLVIVDSVAAVFRCDYELKDMYKRSKHMASLAASLQRLGSKYCLPIVCVNQVINNLGAKVF